MAVKLIQFVGWNPQFLMRATSNRPNFKLTGVVTIDLELRDETDETREFIRTVPIASDLSRVVSCKDRVEDRLIW